MTTPDACLFPHNKPSTAYMKKCRCVRCYAWHKNMQSNPVYKAQNKAYQRTEKSKACRKEWIMKPIIAARRQEQRQTEEYKQKARERAKKWSKSPDGRAKKYASLAARRVKKIKQISTLTAAEQAQVAEIYKRCRELSESTGIAHHVDHIIPVSKGGEHHPDNLQILTAEQNLKKGARIL